MKSLLTLKFFFQSGMSVHKALKSRERNTLLIKPQIFSSSNFQGKSRFDKQLDIVTIVPTQMIILVSIKQCLWPYLT